MRVVTQDRFGGPEVLQLSERTAPEPQLTEIRVRIHAAGINPVDLGTRAGRGVANVIGGPPFVLGWDVSGVVDAVAPGVTRFQVGDEVFGMPWFPLQAGYAELATAPARHFATKPTTLDHSQAGGLALAGLTAWQVLVDTASVQPGQRVLVHGAGGGVGHLMVQIAAALGSEVVATARSPKHRALLALGAHEVVDYTKQRLEEAIGKVDLAVDLVRGDDASQTLEVLGPGGCLVYVPSYLLPDGVAEAAAARAVRATAFLVEPDHAGLAQLSALADAGQLRVLVHEELPLEQAAEAHVVLDREHPLGKIVLRP